MSTRDVFSVQELVELRGFLGISAEELIRFFTLSGADEAFVRSMRQPATVLGVAVQLCSLPWLGFVPDEVAAAPVERLAARLGTTCETGYLGLAVDEQRGRGRLVDDELLTQMSPAHSANIGIALFGTITVDIDAELARLGPTGHRPLRRSGADREPR